MTNASLTISMLRTALWARGLTAEQLRRVEQETQERVYRAGAVLCHKNAPATHWIGVVEGMVKVDNVAADGRSTTFIGVSDGGWLGEGSLLKGELRPYEVVALRDSRIALMPAPTFHHLVDASLPFNRFLIDQLNARLGQFVALVESYRMHDVSSRVACCLAELFNPQLNPLTDHVLQISQEEIGRLAGMSRQIAHRALHELEHAGLVQVRYGSVDVCDVEGLRRYAHQRGESRAPMKQTVRKR
ncbi:Crp/Fnr family transcriptional regulator [Variovorax sp. J22R133]|uniref:Crp/Fnr family transcriptional regulator n=1 Tax=Variovorax brevis TaxID=3053503 RepID=UPI002575B65F|nr:Crp/Fnr family transcriptional regulator [Variovorax sp. J22R133]MDM0116236.1 Crp/Fnr family transcriptional regulator [Variovorax sp. J22R133]